MSNNNIPQATATTSIPHNLNYNQTAQATAIQQNSAGPVLVQGQAFTQDQYRNITHGNQPNIISSEAICRSCGRPFIRPPNCHDASAQYYRCENCNVLKFSDFCIIS